MNQLEFDIRLRATSQAGRWADLRDQACPACDAHLTITQPDVDKPHRLLATCSCEECGIWFALIVRPDQLVTYLIRLPSVVELVEALGRQVGALGPPTQNGH